MFGFGTLQFAGDRLNTRLSQLLRIGGLTFFKNYRSGAIDISTAGNTTLGADFSGGSPTATYSSNSRSASNPATYFDSNGVMQLLTTDGVRRKTQGYYDETGWHVAPSELLEGACTNLILDSYFADSTITNNWRNSGGAEAISRSTDITNVYANATAVGKLVATTSGQSIRVAAASKPTLAANTTYTASAIVSGSGKVRVFFTINNATAFINGTEVTLSASPIRISVTGTQGAAGSVENVGISLATDNAVTCYVHAMQICASAYPCSYIPTTTTAVTRNAESLSYASTGNFPASSGNNCLSFDGASAGGDDLVSIPNSATGNQWKDSTAFSVEAWIFHRNLGEGNSGRIIDKSTASNLGYTLDIESTNTLKFYGNFSGGGVNTSLPNLTTNTWHHVVSVWDGTQLLTYADNSAGTPVATSGTPLDDSALSAIIGNRSAGDRTFDGFIRRVRIFRNKALSSDDVTTLYNAGTFVQNQSSPVTGCTAEYNFTEGTGTTLTDTISANNGTLTNGPIWSKDTLALTVMVKYRPVMLPNEQDASFKNIFSQSYTSSGQGTTRLIMGYSTNASNSVRAEQGSNGNFSAIAEQTATTMSRYASYVVTFAGSTVGDGSGKYRRFYVNNSASNTAQTIFLIPSGVLLSTFAIQTSAGQAMLLESVVIFNRMLSSTEVALVNTILS